MNISEIRTAVLSDELSTDDVMGLVAYLSGVLQSRIANAEAKQDAGVTLPTVEWAAARYGRSTDLLGAAEHFMEAAQQFARNERGSLR